jgi:hypothetical protein
MAVEIAEYPALSGTEQWTAAPAMRDEQLTLYPAVLSLNSAASHSHAHASASQAAAKTADSEPAHKKLCVESDRSGAADHKTSAAAATPSSAPTPASASALPFTLTCFPSRRAHSTASSAAAHPSNAQPNAHARPEPQRLLSLVPGALPTQCSCSQAVVCYVMKNVDLPGKFDAKKAAALGSADLT